MMKVNSLSVRLSCKSLIGALSALVLRHAVVLLLQVQSCEGQSLVVGPSRPVLAGLGDSVVLSCNLEPAVDTSGMTVEWSRQDFNPRFVHVWRDGVELENKKHPSFKGRTSLSINSLKLGDVSLRLSKVTLSDGGKYRCFLPALNRLCIVELVVGVVSFITNINIVRTEKDAVSSGLVLNCESEGWYPEPEVSWLDSEGHVLSAGPPETVRGPDGLYTVSSRVTVEERHGDRFTCRVQQKTINQTRETQIHVGDDFIAAPRRNAAPITISVVVIFSVTLTIVVLVVRKRAKTKIKRKKVSDPEKKPEEQNKNNSLTTPLREHKKELEKLRDKLKTQLEDTETEETRNKEKLESPSRIISLYYRKDEVKTILLDTNRELERRKTGLEECLKTTEEQLKKLDVMIEMIVEDTQQKETETRGDGLKAVRKTRDKKRLNC